MLYKPEVVGTKARITERNIICAQDHMLLHAKTLFKMEEALEAGANANAADEVKSGYHLFCFVNCIGLFSDGFRPATPSST